jgi:hypothetical protein
VFFDEWIKLRSGGRTLKQHFLVLVCNLLMSLYVFLTDTGSGFFDPIPKFDIFVYNLHILVLFLDVIEASRPVLNQPGYFLILFMVRSYDYLERAADLVEQSEVLSVDIICSPDLVLLLLISQGLLKVTHDLSLMRVHFRPHAIDFCDVTQIV